VPLDMSERSYELWERNVHALMVLLVTKGALTVDEMRRAIEYLPPAVYATWGYYEKWAVGISHILIGTESHIYWRMCYVYMCR